MISPALILILAGAGLFQETPWQTDGKAVREQALKDKKSCILLVDSDSHPG